MKKFATLAVLTMLTSCSFLNYKSRQEALVACQNWENEKPAKVLIVEGSMRSKICELEVEARRVVGREIKNPKMLTVYTQRMIDMEFKVAKYFNY